LLFSVAYLVVTPLAACWVFGYGMADLPLLMVLLVNQTLVQMTLFLRSNVSGLGHYRLDSWLSSLDKFLMLFTCGGLLWAGFFEVSAMHFALAQTLALLLTVLLVFGVLRQKADFPIRPSWHNNWRRGRATLWVLLRKSAPFALVVLLMSAYTRLDGILLERILPDGPVHAEVFAGAYRLLDAANMFGYLFASLLLPMFARQLKSDPSGQEVRPLVSLSFRLIWAGSISLAAAVFWGRTELMALMMDMEKESAYRADVMGFLIWAFVPVCANYIFGTLLTAHERLAQMNRFFVAGILLDFVLNLLLVPHWKAFGAVVASLCTQTFVAAAMAGLCMQVFGYRISRSSSLRLLGFVILVLVGDFWIFSRSGWPFFGKLLATGLLSAIALFVFQVIRVKDLKSWSKG
jgi:O-antigen/teichoic acid export membrane protein